MILLEFVGLYISSLNVHFLVFPLVFWESQIFDLSIPQTYYLKFPLLPIFRVEFLHLFFSTQKAIRKQRKVWILASLEDDLIQCYWFVETVSMVNEGGVLWTVKLRVWVYMGPLTIEQKWRRVREVMVFILFEILFHWWQSSASSLVVWLTETCLNGLCSMKTNVFFFWKWFLISLYLVCKLWHYVHDW